jgi:hypothetical protein
VLFNSPIRAQAAWLLSSEASHTKPVALLCTSDQPVAETSTYKIHKKKALETNIHVFGGIFFILLYSVLHLYLFLCLDCPAFYLFVFTYITRQASTPTAVFEHATPASDRLQTLALRPLGHWDRHRTRYRCNQAASGLRLDPMVTGQPLTIAKLQKLVILGTTDRSQLRQH